MTVDTVSDVLTRIRNANLARHAFVEIPETRLSKALAKVIYREGFVRNIYFGIQKGSRRFMVVFLIYKKSFNGTSEFIFRPKLSKIKRVSTPGRRIYKGYKDL